MITKNSTFHQVFGDYIGAYSQEERKNRWEEFKKACSSSVVKMWEDKSECAGCVHLDTASSWCKEYELPCTVNPVFGFKMIGMACRGAGFEALQPELNLFND